MTITVSHHAPDIRLIADARDAGVPEPHWWTIAKPDFAVQCHRREDAAAWRTWLDRRHGPLSWDIHPPSEGTLAHGIDYRHHRQTTHDVPGIGTLTVIWVELLVPDSPATLAEEAAV